MPANAHPQAAGRCPPSHASPLDPHAIILRNHKADRIHEVMFCLVVAEVVGVAMEVKATEANRDGPRQWSAQFIVIMLIIINQDLS